MSALQEPSLATQAVPCPRDSSAPLLRDDRGVSDSTTKPNNNTPSDSKSGGKRRLFGFGKKKDDNNAGKATEAASAVSSLGANTPSSTPMRSPSPLRSPPGDDVRAGRSPVQSPGFYAPLTSPSRAYRSTSPRLSSPASSQIFERNVQETASFSGELSPSIPSHITTEDKIPPVLEASSLAITDDHLNPDEVEIVMHAAHQPAAAAVAGSLSDSLASPLQDDFGGHAEVDDSASNYGSIDTADVRRLSFISFADVVQAEHAESSKDSLHLMSLSSTTANRSPSPVRSPASSHGFGTSPPTSGATSVKGMDAVSAKGIRTPNSPTTHSSPGGGELTIETMRQALRRTGSGDLSGARSLPMSAASVDEGSVDSPPFR